jgi:hypothetical protein
LGNLIDAQRSPPDADDRSWIDRGHIFIDVPLVGAGGTEHAIAHGLGVAEDGRAPTEHPQGVAGAFPIAQAELPERPAACVDGSFLADIDGEARVEMAVSTPVMAGDDLGVRVIDRMRQGEALL